MRSGQNGRETSGRYPKQLFGGQQRVVRHLDEGNVAAEELGRLVIRCRQGNDYVERNTFRVIIYLVVALIFIDNIMNTFHAQSMIKSVWFSAD